MKLLTMYHQLLNTPGKFHKSPTSGYREQVQKITVKTIQTKTQERHTNKEGKYWGHTTATDQIKVSDIKIQTNVIINYLHTLKIGI